LLTYENGKLALWVSDPFATIFKKITLPGQERTLVSKDRCWNIYSFCKHCSVIGGDFVECGVYKGGTAYIIANAISDDTVLHLFDTFDGMPELANNDPAPEKSGDYKSNFDDVVSFLSGFNNICFYRGVMPETFKTVNVPKVSFLHVDVDLYASTRDVFGFFYDKMVIGGVILCDDYGFPGYADAAKRAVDEFFIDKKETPIYLPTGQCLIIKL